MSQQSLSSEELLLCLGVDGLKLTLMQRIRYLRLFRTIGCILADLCKGSDTSQSVQEFSNLVKLSNTTSLVSNVKSHLCMFQFIIFLFVTDCSLLFFI